MYDTDLLDAYTFGRQAEGYLADLPDEQQNTPHHATLLKLAGDGREAEESILANPDHPGYEQVQASWQDEQDQQTVAGLSSGQLVLSPEAQQILTQNESARMRVLSSSNLDQRAKQDVLAQTYASDAEIRRSARPVPPEQRAQSSEAQIEGMMSSMSPENQEMLRGLIVPDGKGSFQVLRGAKPDAAMADSGGDEEEVPERSPVDDGLVAFDVPPEPVPKKVAKGLPVFSTVEEANAAHKAGKLRGGDLWKGASGKTYIQPHSPEEQDAVRKRDLADYYDEYKNVPLIMDKNRQLHVDDQWLMRQKTLKGEQQKAESEPEKKAAAQEKRLDHAQKMREHIAALRAKVQKYADSWAKIEKDRPVRRYRDWGLFKTGEEEGTGKRKPTAEEVDEYIQKMEEVHGIPGLEKRLAEMEKEVAGSGEKGSAAAAAPAAAPKKDFMRISPDGKFGFDGKAWVPVEGK